MRRTWIGVLVGGLVLVAACSSDDDGDGGNVLDNLGGGDASELAARLPAGAATVSRVDLDAAREQLGLPDDSDVAEVDITSEPDRARLLALAALGLPYLNRPQDEIPLESALDTGQVHAAAATGTYDRERGAAIVRTDQSFDDLADALADHGYEATGDMVVADGPLLRLVFPVVADGGDGTIVLAASETAARAVLDGGDEGSPATDLLDQLPGIAAAAGASSDGLECGNGFGVGVDLEPAAGEMVIFAGGDPDPAQALPDPDAVSLLGDLELGDRRVEGDFVHVEFEYPTEHPLQTPTQLVASELVATDIYQC